ncbi:MAG: hypothetical protein KF764_13290 [Labilithrix sp.]|nr:hypothetical protein [Labilithrix sp.]
MTPSLATRRLAESIVVTAAIPAIGWVVDRSDPFFLHYRFPWLVFAPLLVALRHGFTLGFGSAFALGAALILGWRTRLVPMASFPGEPVVGLVALAMIAGQFAELWKREVRRLEGGLAAIRREADRLARAHVVLEASHDRLDEQLQCKASSLRDAMDAASALAQADVTLGADGAAIVDLFAAHCGLEIGELFRVERGAVIGERCASVGRPERTRRDDPLLAHAVRSGRLTYIPAAAAPERDRALLRSSLLAAVPFVDASGDVRAVLSVQAMPFMSFERANLDTMVTVATSFASRLAAEPRDRETRAALTEDASA